MFPPRTRGVRTVCLFLDCTRLTTVLPKGNLVEDEESRLKVCMMHFVIDFFFLNLLIFTFTSFEESRFFDLFRLMHSHL